MKGPAVTRPTPRLPDPYRPTDKPHLPRTAVILALIGAAVVAGVLVAASVLGPVHAQMPRDPNPPATNPSTVVPEPTWLFETPSANR